MNDSFSGKNSKVKVMYVRDDEKSERPQNKGFRSERKKSGDNKDKSYRNESPYSSSSAWQERFKGEEQQASFQGRARTKFTAPRSNTPVYEGNEQDTTAIVQDKVVIDPAQIRRQRNEETRIYGENACKAVFNNRADAIVRAYFLQEVTPRFREALRWMAANRKAYHVVDEVEMQKVSGAEHHGGVCFLIKKRPGLSANDYLATAANTDCVLALDTIQNPYNLGGIIRSAAFFGVNAAVLKNPEHLESGAAMRTADGGTEHVKAIVADDLVATIDDFRSKGYFIAALSTKTAHKDSVPVNQTKLPARTLFILSQDSASRVYDNSDAVVHIAGTDHVESLNISVAAGILLAQWCNQNNR